MVTLPKEGGCRPHRSFRARRLGTPLAVRRVIQPGGNAMLARLTGTLRSLPHSPRRARPRTQPTRRSRWSSARIDRRYETDERCDDAASQAKDLCLVEARAERRIRKAELAARGQGTIWRGTTRG
jgi:hypothetical protein